MIVMKFGGTSVADGERIAAVCEIVRGRLARHPVVVVSALATITDRLLEAIGSARDDDRERLEAVVAEIERRHRWAVAASLETSSRRHDLDLEIDRRLDELRGLLRSLRILGEATPRSADAVLASGELLSSRIVVAALEERGIQARLVDPREIVSTDGRHGAAEPLAEDIARRCRASVLPLVEQGIVPVLGGFVGSAPDGRTTTLGRGGSDLTAAILGAAMEAEEIEIWTDVDGILTADPRLVPGAHTLERVGFAEAAELAYYGAKVLHPASIAPAVASAIPVRVLNTMRPDGRGTLVMRESPGTGPLASVASRTGVTAVRIASRRMRVDPGFLPDVLRKLDEAGVVPDLVVSSEVAVTVVATSGPALQEAVALLSGDRTVDVVDERAIVCMVGAALAVDATARRQALSALAELDLDLVAAGASGSSIAAVLPARELGRAVRRLHARFFGTVPAGPHAAAEER